MTNTNKTVDVAALDLLCDKLECGDANHRATAAQIRKAMNGVERSNDGVDVDALLNLADEISIKADKIIEMGNSVAAAHGKDVNCIVTYPSDTIKEWSDTIRNAIKRPEPEVLDADGVPIKVGDTVYIVDEHPVSGRRTVESVEAGQVWFVENHRWTFPSEVTHLKPDTLESVVTEMLAEWDENNEEFLDMDSYFARFRKLMGGE